MKSDTPSNPNGLPAEVTRQRVVVSPYNNSVDKNSKTKATRLSKDILILHHHSEDGRFRILLDFSRIKIKTKSKQRRIG